MNVQMVRIRVRNARLLIVNAQMVRRRVKNANCLLPVNVQRVKNPLVKNVKILIARVTMAVKALVMSVNIRPLMIPVVIVMMANQRFVLNAKILIAPALMNHPVKNVNCLLLMVEITAMVATVAMGILAAVLMAAELVARLTAYPIQSLSANVSLI